MDPDDCTRVSGRKIARMARDVTELIREAVQLPESDRATLAGAMLESLEPRPTPEVRAAWSREIARRAKEIDDGSVELLDWEEVRAELFADE
jgi:putative addiction module component (TIGR02574 family)